MRLVFAMRLLKYSFFSVLICTLAVACCWGQKQKQDRKTDPATILWKIMGPGCPRASYIIGTFHLTDASWLLKYPEITKVIDSTEYILTEVFTTEPVPKAPQKREVLKALPLLDKAQFEMLDSFFVARVGEGIRNNIDAELMTVAEMEGAILTTLISGRSNANGITKLMDKDLFDLYVKLGRGGDHLDRVLKTDFDSSEIAYAKDYITRAVKYINNSDKPDWNIYQMNGVEEAEARYKQMKVEYRLHEFPTKVMTSNALDFIPLEQRNKNWIPKIIAKITDQPTLIAVGLAHLYYRTGIVMLLREQGYSVEPVALNKP